MRNYTRKRKDLILTLEINQYERHKQFEIKLPNHIKKITGVIITSSIKN